MKIQNTLKWGLLFTIFQHYTITHILFSIFRQDESVTVLKFKFWKFIIHYKMGFIFHGFFSPMRYHTYFLDFPAKSKCRYLKNKKKLYKIKMKCPSEKISEVWLVWLKFFIHIKFLRILFFQNIFYSHERARWLGHRNSEW